MPRVKLAKELRADGRKEIFDRIIAVGMARKGIVEKQQLALLLNIDASCMGKRLSGATSWRYDELCRLFRILELSDEEIARAMGRAAT